MTKNSVLQYFPNVLHSEVIEPYMQKGEWATHNVLPVLLDMFPNAEIRLSSFNISDQSLRTLAMLSKEKKFSQLRLLLDKSLLRNKVALLYFAKNISQSVKLESVHAKILLLKTDTHCFGIVGSQNFNQNKKVEAGVYFTDKKMYQYFEERFDHFYQQGITYEPNGRTI